MAYNETPMKGHIMYHTPEEITPMDPETFVKHWDDGSIVDSCFIELGAMKRSAKDEEIIFDL